GRPRKASEKPETPDMYPVGTGLIRFRDDTEYAPVANLLHYPLPLTPGEGDDVPAGEGEVGVRHTGGKGHPNAGCALRVGGGGKKEVSPAVPAGEKETHWSPAREIKPGEKYTWQVRVVDGTWNGPTASASFRGK